MPVFLIFALLIAVLAVGFALVNNEPVAVQFVVAEYKASLALVLLSTFALGAVVGLLACLPALIRAKLAAHDIGKKLQSLEKPPEPGAPEKPPGDGRGTKAEEPPKNAKDAAQGGPR